MWAYSVALHSDSKAKIWFFFVFSFLKIDYFLASSSVFQFTELMDLIGPYRVFLTVSIY